MKTNRIVSGWILAGLFVYLLIQIFYLSCFLAPSLQQGTWEGIVCLFLIQSVLFAASILVIFILIFFRYRKQKRSSPFKALVLISNIGKIRSEISLQDKCALVITGKEDGKEVFVESAGVSQDAAADARIYGVMNLVSGCWYIEAVSGIWPLGLKRANESEIYRLKEGIPYRLSEADVIYANTCKIVMRQQKDLEG